MVKYSPGTFFEPWNIMCSKRCAKPVRPGFSFFEPTWNHWLTWTIGSLRSTCRMTCRPLGSVNFSNSTFGTAEACGTRGAVEGAAGGRGGGFGAWTGVDDGACAAARRSADCPTDKTTTSADSSANEGVHGTRFDIDLSSGNVDRIDETVQIHACRRDEFGTNATASDER